jgi:hypothetical protein
MMMMNFYCSQKHDKKIMRVWKNLLQCAGSLVLIRVTSSTILDPRWTRSI